MARPKRFSEKLVVGLTPEIKEFLQKEAEKECCEMNAIVRRAIIEYMEQYGGRKLQGYSTDVYKLIKENYSGEKGPLPINAAAFGKQLNQLDVPLKKLGYRFLIDDTGAKGNTITIIKSK